MHIQVQIDGISPLLMSKFTDEAAQGLMKGSRAVAPAARRGTPREIAEKALYTDNTGKLIWPAENLLACITAAGVFHKAGRKQITTAVSSLVPAGVAVLEALLPFNTQEWEVDSRRIVNQSTRGAAIAHRPRLDRWALPFTLEVDETMFDPSLVRELLDTAGKKIGLGAYRPSRKGPFGRFVVTLWKEEKKSAA